MNPLNPYNLKPGNTYTMSDMESMVGFIWRVGGASLDVWIEGVKIWTPQDQLDRLTPIMDALSDLPQNTDPASIPEMAILLGDDRVKKCGGAEMLRRIYDKGIEMEKWYRSLLRTMPYRAYLKTYHWHVIRRKAILRADNRCQVCGTSKNLHVHHRTYENRGSEKLQDLTVLCADCHELFHRRAR